MLLTVNNVFGARPRPQDEKGKGEEVEEEAKLRA
jgi:hypothetical protein